MCPHRPRERRERTAPAGDCAAVRAPDTSRPTHTPFLRRKSTASGKGLEGSEALALGPLREEDLSKEEDVRREHSEADEPGDQLAAGDTRSGAVGAWSGEFGFIREHYFNCCCGNGNCREPMAPEMYLFQRDRKKLLSDRIAARLGSSMLCKFKKRSGEGPEEEALEISVHGRPASEEVLEKLRAPGMHSPRRSETSIWLRR